MVVITATGLLYIEEILDSFMWTNRVVSENAKSRGL